jgi:hypothetical protein
MSQILLYEAGSTVPNVLMTDSLRIIGSGNGEKLHTTLRRPDGGHVEVYAQANRYITMTGDRFDGTPDKLSDLSVLVRRHIREKDKRDCPKRSEKPSKKPKTIIELHRELRALVERGVDGTGKRIHEGERSEAFHHAVGWLKDDGWGVDDIVVYMEQYPTGIIEKYAGRIEQEVKRCFDKCGRKFQPPVEDPSGLPRLYSIGELAERPPPEFLIERMLPEKGVAIIAGPSGVMKTFLMIYLALMIAYGRKLDTITVKRTGVVFLNNEGQAGFAQRCLAALTHHGMEETEGSPRRYRRSAIQLEGAGWEDCRIQAG